jgi:hypothetical protein
MLAGKLRARSAPSQKRIPSTGHLYIIPPQEQALTRDERLRKG